MNVKVKHLWLLGAGLASGLMSASAAPVLPGWLTDPTAMKSSLGKDEGYQPPEPFKYPYVSTYYVKPTVTPDEVVKVGIFVTDFESSRIRFLDDSHRFTAFLEHRLKGGKSKTLTLKNLKSGDAEFVLGKLPAGDYELRVWAKDREGRESHRVIHDFRVRSAADLKIPAGKVYAMTAADLAAYGIRNDGDLEEVVYVGQDGAREVVKRKRAGVPGCTVTVPLDPKTGKVPYRAFEKATVAYDAGYGKAAVENAAVETATGLQKLIDDKAAAGFRRVVLLPGTYRISQRVTLRIPDRFTLDLGGATLKLNAFTGEHATMVQIASAVDAHLVNGALEGDYWTHDYKNSPKDSEWVNGFLLSGDTWYSSVEKVTVREVAGYGGSNYIQSDDRGGVSFFYELLPKFAAGGLDPETGGVDVSDKYRYTSDFWGLAKIEKKLVRRRLQISKYLGYQGVRTRSWQMTVGWYDADKKFLSAETAWQFREMWIPDGAAYLRVSVEAGSLEEANPAQYTEGLSVTAFRYPINCAVRDCRFERCRCVGYAAAQMKNMIFEGNFFTTSGEALAKCAFDAEDGADQMQDAYFLRNKFRDNPVNNSILTCAGHNFILEKNDGSIHFWGRTHSPCVRDNDIEQAEFWCDSRIRSGYARFENNRCTKGIRLGKNEMKKRPDNWDFVLSGLTFDGAKDKFSIACGPAGRIVGCTFRDMESLGLSQAYACTIENCKGYFAGAQWTGVTVKDSFFKNFYTTNSLSRCRFERTTFEGINRSTLQAKRCDFTGCNLIGLISTNLKMENCTFSATTVDGGWWASPATLVFKDCSIATPEKAAFLQVGVYNIGKVGFDGCTVSGRQSLVHVKDLRPLKFYQGENPDRQTGRLVLRDTTWQSEAKTVVTHGTGRGEPFSEKQIVIADKGNAWPKDVAVATDLFETWSLLKK